MDQHTIAKTVQKNLCCHGTLRIQKKQKPESFAIEQATEKKLPYELGLGIGKTKREA